MEKSFSEILLIVPPGTKKLDYRKHFKDSLKFSFEKAKKEISDDMRHYPDASNWPWVQSDAENVLERLQSLPKMSAIAIVGAERLRFPKLERVPGTLASTHTGLRVSHSSEDDLLLPHLHELLRRLLQLANTHQLSIVVLAENFEFESEKLPDDLRSCPELGLVSARYGETERSRYYATLEALKISRTSGHEAAIQFVRQNIPDPDNQAHAISYIYSDSGLWTQAWDILDGHIAKLRNSKESNVLLNMAQAAAGCGEAKSAEELLKEAFEFL